MNRFSVRRFCLFLLCTAWCFSVAQAQLLPREKALQVLREQPGLFGLSAADVAEWRISDEYFSKNNGITHVWLQQLHHGIPVHNGLLGLHVLPNGEVLRPAHRFVPDLARKVNTDLPSLGAARALELGLKYLHITDAGNPSLQEKIDERNFIFAAGNASKNDIPVKAVYAVQPDGAVRLAWNIRIHDRQNADVWSLRIDAQTGALLEKNNLTLSCAPGNLSSAGAACAALAPAPAPTSNADETYLVYPLPVESPAHGARSYVVNPADPLASPYGWLDTDGAPGAEYTYTRGNNTWAFDDSANDNTGTPQESADGGAGLLFDFPLDLNAEPEQHVAAAVTNLFYTTNMVHDFFYHYGFDEESGNFQLNNYGNGGAEGDHVLANAIDGDGINNSSFFTPEDGDNGILQMYKWTRQGGQLLTVNTPAAIDGVYQAGLTNGNWGGPVTTVPLSAEAVLVDDGSAYPYFGCLDPQNNVSGKIVLIERGGCSYGEKALQVEQAGALACIICNFEEGPAVMGIGAFGEEVTIPVISIGRTDCDKLKQYAGAGLHVSIALPSSPGPEFLDGDFDNGIIAHEYGHGISNRLTGGPSQIECLANLEQMGEGWSDWVTLVTTIRPGDMQATPRGIGTYIRSQPNDATGFRRYPYSTDMSVNPVTYGWVAATSSPTQVHPRGEPWAAACWDLYWALVEKYGYDSDWTNTNSGNGRAIQLVVDGMKLQPCLPGYIEARDAILMADKADFGGADTCLISTVFARRGLGYLADQGSSFNVNDGVENFDPIPACVKELKIEKIALNPVVNAGDEATFVLRVTNHKDDAVSDVLLSDELPEGLSIVTASFGWILSGNRIEWTLPTLASGQTIDLTYTVKTDPAKSSVRLFLDPMEDATLANWTAAQTEGTETFYLQTQDVWEGNKAWKADSGPGDMDMTLENNQLHSIPGDQPVLRFWHKYNTQVGVDAGFLQAQVDGKWGAIPGEYLFRSPYKGRIQYQNFVIPFLEGFHGNSGGWTESYVDLSAYAGKDIRFSFRFGTYDNTANGAWVVDAVELIDMFNYNGEVCVSSAEGDQACAKAAGRGVVVNPVDPTGADMPVDFPLSIQPNPVSGYLSIQPGGGVHGPAALCLIGADGYVAFQRRLDQFEAGQTCRIELGNLPAGMYLLRVETEQGVVVKKVVKGLN